MIDYALVMLIFGGLFGVLYGWFLVDEDKRPYNQATAVGVLIAAGFPIIAPLGVLYGVFKGVPWLFRGFTGLYRHTFPKKVKLPKATIHDPT